MGLAPYGKPKYKKIIFDNLIDLKDEGSFFMDQSYFNYSTGLTMTNKKFSKLFGLSIRKPDIDDLTQFHMDIASSIQAVTEEVVLTMTRSLAREYEVSNLCMAGGVALNCVANGKIINDHGFSDIWIQPAAGDAGGALGTALEAWYSELGMPRKAVPHDSMSGAFLGPLFDKKMIEESLVNCGVRFETISENEMLEQTVFALKKGKAVGWFQGRMEFGARALGCRSILCDPRSESTQKTLNLKVKFRESFRPFAPAVLQEDQTEWFELDYVSPYMMLVDNVKHEKCRKISDDESLLLGIEKLNIKHSEIPAVTHVDYSERIQTVIKKTNPRFHALITRFKEKTGCPVIVNTSFNVRGEPIVCTPEDAFICFMATGLDMLVIGNSILYKKDQDQCLMTDYKNKYELD